MAGGSDGGRISRGPSLIWRRIAAWAAIACGALLGGAGLGFLARDLLGLGQPAVTLAWIAGFALALSAEFERAHRHE